MIEKSLTLIEETFSDFLMRKISAEKFEKNLSFALSSLPFDSGSKHFEVTIVNQNRKDPFFGMYVYPVMNEMDAFVEDAVNKAMSFKNLSKKWRTIADWCIEIDAQCFDRNELNFNPKELTAMLLHEIGHVIYSDKPVERWYRMYQDAKSKIKLTDKPSLKVLYSLYTIPLTISCMQRNWVTSSNSIKIEYFADKSLVEHGYADSLVSAMDKIIKCTGSQNQTEEIKNKRVASSIDWCNVNTTDFVHRSEKLKDEIFYQSIRTQSGYFKSLALRILGKLGVKVRDKYTGIATECTFEMLCDPELYLKYSTCYESASLARWNRLFSIAKPDTDVSEFALEAWFKKNSKSKEPKLPSQYDIDMIQIEIDKITNHYDRTYVLDLIYKQLEDIEIFEDYIQNDKAKVSRYSGQIANYRNQLDTLRKACLSKKILDKEYRCFVKYPVGYEG